MREQSVRHAKIVTTDSAKGKAQTCRARRASYRRFRALQIHGAGTTMIGRITTRLTHPRFPIKTALAALAALAIAGCGHHKKGRPKSADLAASKVTTIGVNSYLWRASLDALSFMPLVQTDSNGGVIVTDWYANPGNPGERMKVTVTILDQDLRADALRVAASRQVSENGTWVDAPVAAATVQRLEDVILTKARDLRRSASGG